MKKALKLIAKDYDPYLLFSIFLLGALGLLSIYSASYSGQVSSLFFKQLIYLIAGLLLVFFLSRLNFKLIYDMAPAFYFANLFLLVLVPFVGKVVYGAKRWIDLGPVSLQPSEFMKLSLALFLLYTLEHTKRLKSKETVVLLSALVMPTFLTYKQPDLGTAITYLVVFLSLLFLKGIRLRYFILAGFLLLVSSPFLWHALKDYQKKRILALFDPYEDYHGSGYQLIQSVIAVGSGQLTGKGFLKGTQSQLFFLPEKHTDFVFAVFAEEWGFVGSLLMVSVLFFIGLRIAYYAYKLEPSSERLFLGAFVSLWTFQVSVNLLMTTGWMPVVGIPLPFVSYGGSAMLTFCAFLGISLSIIRDYRNRPIKFEDG